MDLAVYLAILIHRITSLFWRCLLLFLPVPTPIYTDPSPDHQKQAILILGNGDGVSRAIALSFALKGYTVLLQTAHTENFGPIISQWQANKYLAMQEYVRQRKALSRLRNDLRARKPKQIALTRPGTLIPLLFQCADSYSRQNATATIKAYLRNNGLTLTSVVNTFDPAASPVESAYTASPVPLTAIADEHLCSLVASVTASHAIMQDLLVHIVLHRTRIVNVWLSYPKTESSTALLESIFKTTALAMRKELSRLGVSVTLVQPSLSPAGTNAEYILARPITSFKDKRTIISPDMPETLRRHIAGKIQSYERSIATQGGRLSANTAILIELVCDIAEGRELSSGAKFAYTLGLNISLRNMVELIVPLNLRLYLGYLVDHVSDGFERLLVT